MHGDGTAAAGSDDHFRPVLVQGSLGDLDRSLEVVLWQGRSDYLVSGVTQSSGLSAGRTAFQAVAEQDLHRVVLRMI
jgi:hypothetical protein